MSADLESILGALGLTLKNVIAGAVGSFISLRFFEGLSTPEKWSTFFGGWALGAYIGSPLSRFLEVDVKVDSGIALLVGLFGMAVVAAIIKAIRDTRWAELIKARFGGGNG